MKLGQALIAMPLSQAALCPESTCEIVFLLRDWDVCPVCGSKEFLLLEKVIGSSKIDDADLPYPLSRAD